MFYTNILFLVFFALVWGITRILRPWPVVKEWWLIAFSLLVIASWGYYDLTVFLAVLLVNFVAVKIMGSHEGRGEAERRKAHLILTGTISFDILVLAFFKYTDFVGGSLGAATGLAIPKFPLGIPLAISFYTFHLISYMVDIHAGRTKIATFRQYVFYLSFFPHVVAGPIVRAWQLIPQIGRTRRVRTDAAMGLHYLVTGLFLKLVAANNIARAIDPCWDTARTAQPLSLVDHWLVAFLYYCQIYGDFAGYTLMALGMSRLLGYRLPPNFRGPMLASSLREFWQRWHITLSRWLRDYLYIPLGGNRVPPGRAAANVMITMLLGGLWHGAGWGFLIWGAMHGAGIVGERYLWRGVEAVKGAAAGLGLARASRIPFWPVLWLVTQTWVTLAWVFFRAPGLPTAFAFLKGMADISPGWHLAHDATLSALVCSLPVLMHHGAQLLLPHIPRRHVGLVLGLATGIMLAVILVTFSPSTVFIYFNF
jgi:alginate O-acetyltransferase complex protein AlgI